MSVYLLVLVLAMKDPIPLWHFRKKEILAKIDLMEDWFDEPMTFDESLIPAHVAPIAAGEEMGSWGYGVSVYGTAQGHRREVVTLSLMSNMYGFAFEEEMGGHKGLPV